MNEDQFAALQAAATDGIDTGWLTVTADGDSYDVAVPDATYHDLTAEELRAVARRHSEYVSEWYFWAQTVPDAPDRSAFLQWLEDGDDDTAVDRVDQVLTKWLSAFLDEGSAHWSMPNREAGFYTAFRGVAEYDNEIPDGEIIADLPEQPAAAIEAVLTDQDGGRGERGRDLVREHHAWERTVRETTAALAALVKDESHGATGERP